MSTPIQKEFGPGYDYPNRKFHFLAVILPTVVLVALAVALMRDIASTSSKARPHSHSYLPEADVPRTRVHGAGVSSRPRRRHVGCRIERSADC